MHKKKKTKIFSECFVSIKKPSPFFSVPIYLLFPHSTQEVPWDFGFYFSPLNSPSLGRFIPLSIGSQISIFLGLYFEGIPKYDKRLIFIVSF